MRGFMLRNLSLRRLALPRTSIVKNVSVNAGSVGFVVQQRNNSGMKKPISWNVNTSSLSGFWSHLTNEDAREQFQSFVDQKIIDQEVLTQNLAGRIHMFALLHGLMNPLLRKYQFDAVEFVNAVGPALQIYHETLLQLMMEATVISEVKSTSAKEKEEILKQRNDDVVNNQENDDDSVDNLDSWRIEAGRDPKSFVGRFMKMATYENLKEQYHNAQMIKLFSEIGIPSPMNYVAGTCDVEYVSLLNIKAIEVDDQFYEENEHPKFAVSSDADLPVLARVQVLYKLSRKFQKRNNNKSNSNHQISSSPASAAETYKSINTDVTRLSSTTTATTTSPSAADTATDDKDSNKTVNDTENGKRNEGTQGDSDPSDDSSTAESNSSRSNQNSSHHPEIYSETRYGLATLEGWLNGGSNTSDNDNSSINHYELSYQRPTPQLRWRVVSTKELNHVWYT